MGLALASCPVALLALVPGGVGVYGVLAYSVEQRTHESGMRIAMRAGRRDVSALVMNEGVGLVVLGMGSGAIGGVASTRTLRSLLYGVHPGDRWTLLATVVGLATVAALACYLPARWATRVDSMEALRYEQA